MSARLARAPPPKLDRGGPHLDAKMPRPPRPEGGAVGGAISLRSVARLRCCAVAEDEAEDVAGVEDEADGEDADVPEPPKKKMPYEAPTLTELGTLINLTRGNNAGGGDNTAVSA